MAALLVDGISTVLIGLSLALNYLKAFELFNFVSTGLLWFSWATRYLKALLLVNYKLTMLF
jgi:hypothetical protein